MVKIIWFLFILCNSAIFQTSFCTGVTSDLWSVLDGKRDVIMQDKDRQRREVRGHPQRNKELEVTQADAQTKTLPDRGPVFDSRKNVGKEQSSR